MKAWAATLLFICAMFLSAYSFTAAPAERSFDALVMCYAEQVGVRVPFEIEHTIADPTLAGETEVDFLGDEIVAAVIRFDLAYLEIEGEAYLRATIVHELFHLRVILLDPQEAVVESVEYMPVWGNVCQ